MAIFKVEGGRRLRGEITPQGAKNEALQILCATLLTQEKVIVHNVPQILDVIQLIELLQAMGVEVERLSEESYSFRAADIDPDYLRSDDYCRRASRLRGSVMLLGPMLARFGVGYMPKPGGDKIGRRRRGFGDRHGQYHHGGCDGQGFHDHLQRRMRTLHPATVPDAQPHGRTHLGHRLEPAHHRGCPGAARPRTHAAARHDRGRQLHRSGSHDPFGADDPQRFVREPGHHPRPVRPSGHPLRTARRRHPHSPAGPLQHRDVPRRFDHDHRRRTLAGAHARPAVGIPRGGHPSQRLGADSPEDVRKPPVFRR